MGYACAPVKPVKLELIASVLRSALCSQRFFEVSLGVLSVPGDFLLAELVWEVTNNYGVL